MVSQYHFFCRPIQGYTRTWSVWSTSFARIFPSRQQSAQQGKRSDGVRSRPNPRESSTARSADHEQEELKSEVQDVEVERRTTVARMRNFDTQVGGRAVMKVEMWGCDLDEMRRRGRLDVGYWWGRRYFSCYNEIWCASFLIVK